MRNSCKQTSTLSNTAEIVESKLSFEFTPLPSNKDFAIFKTVILGNKQND
jgi:hypothetical protein